MFQASFFLIISIDIRSESNDFTCYINFTVFNIKKIIESYYYYLLLFAMANPVLNQLVNRMSYMWTLHNCPLYVNDCLK